MREAVERFDWASTPVGARPRWPASLAAIIETMLDSKVAMFVAWGPDLTFFYNDAYAEFLGARHPNALGRPIARVWFDVWPSISPLIDRAMAGEAVAMVDMPLTMTHRGQVEETWWTFAYSPLRDETGKVCGVLDIAAESTAKVQNERSLALQQTQLAQSSSLLRQLNADLEAQVVLRGRERATTWQATPYLMSVIDLATGMMERVNPAWETVLGFTSDQLEQSPFADFVHPDDLAGSAVAFERVRRGDPVLEFENRYRTKDGGWRWLSWVAVPLEGKLYSTARDVTAERQRAADLATAQSALTQSQKMEAVGQLTGGVAHDFNNLLTVIRGSAELLRRPGLSEERRLRYIDAIAQTADRATKLTSQLLAFARRQALTPEVFDCGESVRSVAAIIQTMTGSRLLLEVVAPDEPCFVYADRSQFDTAVVNMSLNARDAMNGEGRLTVTVGPVSSIPAIRAHAPVPGDYVAIAVNDTGTGIAPNDMARVFEPFFTTKAPGQGTGLGLSQVFGFAKQSGGDVQVHSTLGTGSTFTVYLPRVHEGSSAEQQPTADIGPDPREICVLVVEDNDSVGDFAVHALRELGYDTKLARSGEAALADLTQNCDHIHVVFSDVVMPGMSGIELAQKIGERYPNIPVILTSGYSHVLAQNDQHGFQLLHKPYSIEQLSRVFRRTLSAQAMRPR